MVGFGFALLGLLLGMGWSDHVSAQDASSGGTGAQVSLPFISAIADQSVDEDSPTVPLRVLYGDAQTPVTELRLVAHSSNEKLLPSQNIVFNRATEMVMVPAFNQYGVTTVTLTVENAQGQKASRNFRLTVKAVNDPPEIAAETSVTILEDDKPVQIPLRVTDPESSAEELTVVATSLNPQLIQNLSTEGTGQDRVLSLQPVPDQHGSATIGLTVRDPQGAVGRLDLSVRVLPVNDPPRSSALADQRIFANQSLDPVLFTLTDDETVPSEIILEGYSSNPLLVPAGNILFGGAGELRTLSLRPERNRTGTALITVRAYDREQLESTRSLLLTVENAPPELAGLANTTIDPDKTPVVLPFTIADPDGSAELVRVEASSSNPDLVSRSGLQLGGAGQNRSLTITPTPGGSGTAEITVTATDSEAGQRRVSFTLTVRPAALRPIAQPLAISVLEDTPAEIVVKGESASGRSLAYAIVSTPQKGLLTGEPPRLTFTPAANASGTDSFRFKVTDGTEESLPATVSITIQEINDPPTVSAIPNRSAEPGKSTGPIRFTVEDLETPANKLSVTARSSDQDLIPDQNIALSGQDAVREVTIVPAGGRTGTAVITLTVKDGGGLSANTLFDLKVIDAVGAPKGEPQFVVTPEDVPVAISLRARVADGQALSFAIVDAPSKGTLSGFPPNFVYRPKPNENGQDRFTFKVSNAAGESSAVPVEILVIPINDQPVARSQSYSVNEDATLEIELAAGDPDKDPITFDLLNFPTRGKLSGSPPRLTYTPNRNEAGTDQFTFTASDGELISGPGTIRITIEPVNDPPTASGLFVSTLEDTAVSVSLKGTDVDDNALVYVIGTLPAKGLLAGTPPDLVYIPNPNTTGLDRLTYSVSDGKASSEQAVVTVMIMPANDPPVAESQFLSLAEDSSADILLGARDVDNDPLSFVIVSAPLKGSLSGTPPRLIYRPDPNLNGIDSFTYKINDGTSDSQPATITLSVRAIDDPPTAADQFVTLDEDTTQPIILTGRDVEAGLLSFQIVEFPKHGSIAGVPPLLSYTPERDFSGDDRFTFKVSDGDRESAPATVRISVRSVNDAPVTENQFLSVARGRSRIVTLTGRDAEGSALQFFLTSLPSKGVLSGQPPDLVYLPNPNERGLDSFSFKVSDGVLESLPGTIQLALTEKTSGPTISKIADQTTRNGEPTAKLPFTIRDLETAPDKLVVAASSSTPGLVPVGNIVVEGAGESRTVQVTPAGSKPGTATITLVVWDEDGLADSAQFALTVVAENRTPIAENLSLTASEDQPLPIELKAGDPDKDRLTFTIASPPTKGRLSGSPPILVYTPDPNVTGTDVFTFKARDGSSESATATVTIQILPLAPNQPPTIELVHPVDLSVIDPTSSLVLEANASDPDGDIERVDFLAGATLIGSSTAAPYKFAWSTPIKGQYALTARAIDDRGQESVSPPVTIRVEQPAGRVAILAGGDDPDLALMRRYLFELPIRWRLIPHAEAKTDELLRQYDAVLWHQPSGTELQSTDLNLLESLAKAGTPLYFLGNSLLASRASLPQGERARWQTLIHLMPGGTSWLNQITILEETDHPLVRNGAVGSVARFAYPVTAQQSGVQAGLPGEVVLGRSGTFDILVAAVDAKSSVRTFTHHLRLSGASDAFGTAEQAKLFKNAIGWLLAKQYFMDLSVEVEAPAGTVVVGQPFQYRIVIRHSGESPASQVAVTDALPPEIRLVRAEMSSGSWSQREGVATFELGQFSNSETKTILVTAAATRTGSYSHLIRVQMLGQDVLQENNSFSARVTVAEVASVLPKLLIRVENRDAIRLEMVGGKAGANYAWEVSNDLLNWFPLGIAFVGPDASATFPSGSWTSRFFRVVSIDTPKPISPADQP